MGEEEARESDRHTWGFSRTLSTHAQPHASTHTPNTTPNTHPTKRMTRHFTTKSFLLVAALLVVAVSAAEAASGSRALLQVINIPLLGTVDFQNVAPFYGQIFSGLIPSDALPFGTDSIAEAGITQGLQSGLNSFAGHTLFEG